MATPHISAEKGDFAKVVLMPGDPLRAQLISEKFLKILHNGAAYGNIAQQGRSGGYGYEYCGTFSRYAFGTNSTEFRSCRAENGYGKFYRTS